MATTSAVLASGGVGVVDGKNFGNPGQKRRKNQTSDLLWIAPLSGRKALHLTFFFAPRSLRLTFGGSHPLAVDVDVDVGGGGGGRLTLLYNIYYIYIYVYVYIGLIRVYICCVQRVEEKTKKTACLMRNRDGVPPGGERSSFRHTTTVVWPRLARRFSYSHKTLFITF